MKSYEVKQISTILSHFYNLEKLKKTSVFIVSKTIFFLIIAVEPLRSCFFEKCALFTASMAAGMCIVFKQNRPLWERAFLGASCTCNGLVCSLQSHLCSFFSFYKDQKKQTKKKQETKKNNKLRSDPLPLGFAILFFCWFFVFLVSWCFAFLVRCYFEGLAKKSCRIKLFATFPP